jgi:hypothetical protein
MPIFILMIAAQLFCAYHVVSTGRDKYWIWLIIMAPGIGCLIYLVTQIIPDAGNSRGAHNLKKGAIKILDPNKELREAQHAFDLVESVENRLRLADALYGMGQHQEAEPHLKHSLVGAHKNDPHILMRLASIRLELGDAQDCLALLDQLQANNKGFQSQEGHLLYSRALEADGQVDEALKSYSGLVDYATGEEARVRYGLLLQYAGEKTQAATIFEEVIARVNRGTKFYRKSQQDWKARAQQGLSSN